VNRNGEAPRTALLSIPSRRHSHRSKRTKRRHLFI